MGLKLAEMTAVVTGGANGIGRACALRFARDGATVAILDHEPDPLGEVAEEIRANGGTVLPIIVNLTDRPATKEAFARIDRELAPIGILLNNVGQTARERVTEFWRSEPETWDFVIDVSLKAALMCTRQVVGGMRERKMGKIVSMSSDAPLVGDTHIADYAAAKFGIVGFTRSLARELAPFGVTVNAVAPGVTNTRGPKRMAGDAMARALAQVPMGELCEPDDIANAVAFLASDQARMVTGQVLAVNGGRAFH